MNSKVTKKNRSVFDDLGFDEAEAENLRIRAAMMNSLIAHLERRKLTQARAAELLNVTQPRISDLMRGKLHLFSIDTLVNMLAAAGLRIEIRIRRVAFSPSRLRAASAAGYASRR